MSGGKEPGPALSPDATSIDAGTSARIATPAPGPSGVWLSAPSEALFVSGDPDSDVVSVPLFAYGLPGPRIPEELRADPGNAGLIEVNRYGLTPEGEEERHKLTPATVAAFLALRAAAAVAGFDRDLFTIESAYRSASRQRRNAARARVRYGSEAAARRWVAQGVSEHITGRTIDFNLGMRNDSTNVGRMRRTRAWQWLRDNAPRYGFAPYGDEPWHWSYNPIA